MPAAPGARFAVVKAEIALGALETLFNCPAKTGRASQFGECRAHRGEDQMVGLPVGFLAVAPDQQPALETFFGRPGQRHPRPIVEPEALGTLAGGKSSPVFGGPLVGDRSRIGLDEPIQQHQAQGLVRADRQHIGLTTILEHVAEAIIAAIERVCKNPSARGARIERRSDQLPRLRDLGGEGDIFRHLRLRSTIGVARPAFRQI